MKVVVQTLLLSSFISVSAFAHTLKFNVSDNGYPPYTVKTENGEMKGIFMEVLKRVAEQEKHQIEIISLPRKRVLSLMRRENVDVTIAAKEWISDASGLIFTQGILNSRDVLFSSRSAPLLFTRKEDLFDKTLATHLGYYYPYLDALFAAKKVHRLDALSFDSMLKLALSKRADAVVLNRDVGLWMIKNDPSYQGKFISSDKAINTFQLRLMLHEKWQPFVDKFNQEVSRMRESGQLQAIVDRYR